MATVDLKRQDEFNQKKCISVASATLVGGTDVTTTDTYELFNLPADCLVVDAYVSVAEAGDATRTADIGFAGGAELIDDGSIAAVAVVKTNDLALETGTGKTVTMVPSGAITQGKFIVTVKYIEYTKNSGEYTN